MNTYSHVDIEEFDMSLLLLATADTIRELWADEPSTANVIVNAPSLKEHDLTISLEEYAAAVAELLVVDHGIDRFEALENIAHVQTWFTNLAADDFEPYEIAEFIAIKR
jgi:hypothetical protein